MASEPSYPFVDLELSRRLERAEGDGNARFVEAHRRYDPGCGAEWIEVAGTRAMFDGVSSPITQTFGLGMSGKVTEAELEKLEAFFRDRGAPTCHEISPLADASLLPLLCQRGYQPIELTSILFRPITPGLRLSATRNEKLRVRRVESDEAEVFAKVAEKGWAEFPEVAGMIHDLAVVGVLRGDGHSFVAELDGQPIASGGMSLYEGVALMAGASTVPEARKQGAQLALLEARLRFAAEQGCDLAMIGALPGSGSQRNAERHGFRIAYTRIKWKLGA